MSAHRPCDSEGQPTERERTALRSGLGPGITVYRPNQRRELGVLATWSVMARNVWSSRELVWQLFKRDFLASYKKSFIGFTWLFIMPIIGILSWVFMQKTGLLRPGSVGIPYPAYVLIGTSMWGLFIGFYMSGRETLSSSASPTGPSA